MDNRVLTTNEKKGIRLLMKRHCANHDPSIGCLRMDWPCYMCNKYYTGAFCTYFVKALLPLDSVLEASLQDRRKDLKTCAFCQKEFVPKTHERYCGAFCKTEARKETLRKSKRKERASKKSGG